MSVPEALEKAVEGSGNKFTAIYIAVLAVILAVCSVGGDNASKDMMRASIDIADTYAFFQAKNIRQTIYEMAADDFEMERAKPNVPEAVNTILNEKIAKYRATAKRYESEPATGDGKKSFLPRRGSWRSSATSRSPAIPISTSAAAFCRSQSCSPPLRSFWAARCY
ncbi:MAG: DUF4337 domain-containing protein [Rhodomicrobium sp.]|nr:DUF4337 domain-containing protein [Rhodomicrobium sp.]